MHLTLLIFSLGLAVLTGTTYVAAQNARDVFNLFSTMMRATIVEGAKAEWNKLPPRELACVDQHLQQRGSSVYNLREQGITPSDARLSNLRAVCRIDSAPPP